MQAYGKLVLVVLAVMWAAPKVPFIKDLLPQAIKA